MPWNYLGACAVLFVITAGVALVMVNDRTMAVQLGAIVAVAITFGLWLNERLNLKS